MCAIAGILHLDGATIEIESVLRQMTRTLSHRGPNAEGYYFSGSVGLGHRRLSIIDLSAGQQPLKNEDETVIVVFNGEIYNFIELRNELINLGHTFKTNSDTEVIVHGWEEWGESCVSRFQGMFAFALWDERNKSLFLARDHLGVKPLYYSVIEERVLVFGSELKSILAYPNLNRTLDPHAIEDYFALGYIPDPKTILKEVKKLEAGYSLHIKFKSKTITPKRYWNISFNESIYKNKQDIFDELYSRIKESVKMQMVSDVPLGAFLSGGVDSSSVVAMMSSDTANSINTFSISFKESSYNEAPYARKVSELFMTNHHEERVQSEDASLLDILAKLYDEPFADSSALPTYRLCEMTKKYVTVALSGDGGDEVFGGYAAYGVHMRINKIRNIIPNFLRKSIFASLGANYPKLDWAPKFLRGKRTFEYLGLDLLDSIVLGSQITSNDIRSKIWSDGFRDQLSGYNVKAVFQNYASEVSIENPLSLMQYLDMKTYLPGDILTKVDRASMAHSLEVRVPLLDHKLIEWAASLNPNLLRQDGRGKFPLRKAMESKLPNEILSRRKQGFSVPIDSWFRGSLSKIAADAINSENLKDLGIFDNKNLEKIFNEHQSGLWNHGSFLWALISFVKSIEIIGV